MNLAQELYDTLSDPIDAPEYKRALARRVIRIPIDLEVDGQVAGMIAETRDVTPTSMGIFTKKPLPERKRVRLRRDEESPWCQAVVVHCVGTVGGFKIGLEMIDE